MQHKNVTNYMRKAITSYSNKTLDFKTNDYVIASYNDLHTGKLPDFAFNKLNSIKGEEEVPVNNYQSTSCDIIISYLTIKTNYDGQAQINNDIDVLTGVYFIPAKLDSSNFLSFDINKLPWIPREFLEPMTEPVLALGKQTDYDALQSDFVGRKHQIKTWNDYMSFSKDFIEKFIDLNVDYEKEVYIFKDTSVISTMHILPFYDFLLNNDTVNALYSNFISCKKRSSIPLIDENKKAYMMHKGQMNNQFPLNDSQRECITHFQESREGDILAINGPPGTGKTTLLQTILANMLVDHAIEKKDAPIIVGTSTNNQAVKNIISSFSNTESKNAECINTRWIDGVNSFALYMPSKSKLEEEQRAGIQVDNHYGQYFNSRIDCEENKKQSEIRYRSHFESCFGFSIDHIDQAIEHIHGKLIENENLKERYLSIVEKFKIENIVPKDMPSVIFSLKNQLNDIKKNYQSNKDRILWWEEFFKNLPWWMKLFKFLKPVNQKIRNKCSREIRADEVFIKDNMQFFEIETAYSCLLRGLRDEMEHLSNKYDRYVLINSELQQVQNDVKRLHFDLDFETLDLKQANISLDKSLRHHQFWLAVHYYEGKWLITDLALEPKLSKTNYSFVIKQKMKRWAMITPFYVSTLFMIPNHFSGYKKDTEHRDYLIDFIDLMIIDEAGQVSPEIAACSFALAKKALIVGDENQIEPVFAVSKALDRALAIDENVISESQQGVHPFLNCSESSVMRVASNRCDYEKFDNKGLFLSEHRRCYDEIIEYCNKLMYHGHLLPKRGSYHKIKKMKKNISGYLLLPMMHIHVQTDHSTKRGNSRINANEANKVAKWIKDNFSILKSNYPDIAENELIAVITPFKAQVIQIKMSLKRIAPSYVDLISVGTVHTFQGAERPIVLFSTVYGNQDGGCYFIDSNPSMLNVAVSRAKDAFITIGDYGCLSDNEKSPSGLLKSFLVPLQE